MSDQMFVKSSDPIDALEGQALRDSKHKMCAILDAENPHEYRFNAMQGQVEGTLVPLHSRKGGIRGSNNCFGQIVAGVRYVKKGGEVVTEPFAPTWLGQMIPGGKKVQEMEQVQPPVFDQDEAEVARANEELEAQKMAREAEFRQQVAQQGEAEQQLAMLLQDTSPDQPLAKQASQQPEASADPATLSLLVQAMAQLMTQPITTPSPPEEPTIPKEMAAATTLDPGSDIIRVKMSGSFGSYRGNFLHCYSEGQLVILVYSRDSEVFTPPQSQEPFELSCNGETYTVYFPGIEFELPFANCGIQVMIKE